MRTLTATTPSLDDLRQAAAQDAWEIYDIGIDYRLGEQSGWEYYARGTIYERSIFLETTTSDNTIAAKLAVKFHANSDRIDTIELRHNGHVIGTPGSIDNDNDSFPTEIESARAKLGALRSTEALLDEAYHRNDAPLTSDANYDAITRLDDKITAAFPNHGLGERKVGAAPDPTFPAGNHILPMLSLDNAFSTEELTDFHRRLTTLCQDGENPTYDAEFKIDGLSISLFYEGQKFIRALTRGDGTTGENVTANVRTIASIPELLPATAPDAIEIRGEIYMSRENFEAANIRRQQQGKEIFANLRNAAAGSLRHHDPEETRARNLSFAAYGIGHTTQSIATTEYNLLSKLREWSIPTVQTLGAELNIEHLHSAMHAGQTQRSDLGFDIDGIVVKVSNLHLREAIGFKNRSPRWAIAYKFAAERAKTKLLSIDIQVGRTGTLTPVARLEPVSVGGVTVNSSTLHNQDHVRHLDLRPGDMVILERAGDVIPKIVSRVEDPRSSRPEAWKMPTHCPACNSPSIKNSEEAATRCSNAMTCPASSLSKFEHLVSRDVLDIDGLAGGKLEPLLSLGLLKEPADIFKLRDHRRVIVSTPGWGPTSADNLLHAIETVRTLPLHRLIISLGIRECGRTASKDIADHFLTLSAVLAALKTAHPGEPGYTDLTGLAGIGPKMAFEISQWFDQPRNVAALDNLLGQITVQDATPIIHRQSPISGQTIVFTGSLTSSSRPDAESKAKTLGAKTSSSISTKTTILVVGENGGQKRTQAELLNSKGANIRIISEAQWLEESKV